ncbi:hypothetical protein THRCLA_01172 [Thraustotheca clavata]|uniref:Uncharacterized protein n=1 Tax=Thraustotheca clavata TaxID=74557 RepID=A0A1W0A933_9STRA|nr:hypothetical protein THRCLA_01172 [Thraustotheca clavata]
MRQLMVHKKLEERKRFDSADYAMQNVATQAQAGIRVFRDGMADVEQEAPKPTTYEESKVQNDEPASKYGALSARNIILRRKLTERTKFDSADYHLKMYGVHTDKIGSDQVDVDMGTDDGTDSVGDVDMEAIPTISPRSIKPPSPRPMSPAMPLSPSSKYGKLCAANILIRKKLKERKRFDSADYSMEHNGMQRQVLQDATPVVTIQASTFNNNDCDVRSPAMKHLKLNSAATPSRDTNSPTSRVAAQNILIQRKLAERKRFDSADHYARASS